MTVQYTNLLIDELPEKVIICGAEREINSDFRTAMLFEMLMDDGNVPDEDKGIQAIKLFFPVLPKTPDETADYIRQMLWFYRCGKEPNEYMRQKEKRMQESGQTESRIYDFGYDDDYIYAAFIQQYGINLNAVGYMHWWEFRALFKALTNQTEFVKIMEYRGMEITKDLSDREKAFYKKMKAIYELPKPKEESERMDAIVAALMGDGDVDKVLSGGQNEFE